MNTEILAARAKEGDADAFPNVTVDGVRLSMGGGFYDGYYMSNEGGGMCLKDEDVENYRFADGSMEYRIHLSTTERGFMLNKPIHVEFREIGYNTSELSEPVTDVEGSWTIEWTLQGSNEIYEADIEHGVIRDTGATLTHVELSPISARILVRYPKKEERVFWTDDDGNVRSFLEWEMPPQLVGAKMKDGTSCYYAWVGGGGSAGYRGQEDICEMICNGEQILDVHQIEYLMFVKDYPEDGNVTDDNFWFVKVR